MAQRLKEEVRLAITNAAVDLMLEKGIESTDMRTVAKNANITTGNLYRYFKNRQELLDSISMPVIEKLQESVSRNSAGYVALMQDENLDIKESKIGTVSIDDIIIKTVSDSFLIAKENQKVARVLVQSNQIKELIGEWIASALLNNKNISKKKAILIKVHISSTINSINTLLNLGLDLTHSEFMEILEFYIPSLNKTLIDIWGQEND